MLCQQDAILPFVTDTRWSEDTMFWVFENDWRLWEPGHEPTAVKERLERRFAPAELELDADRKKQDEPAPVDTSPKVTCREVFETCFMRNKGSTDGNGSGVLKCWRDIMMMLTLAHRADCGDLVWLSWAPKKKSKSQPSHGTTFVSIVPNAARKILSAINDNSFASSPGHWDVLLRDWLKLNQETTKSSHCWPSMGSFVTHRSGCEREHDTDAGRPSEFHENYNASGTRKSEDPLGRDKYIARFQAKGGAEWKLKVTLPEYEKAEMEPIRWWTFDASASEPTATALCLYQPEEWPRSGVWDEALPLEEPWSVFEPQSSSGHGNAASSSSSWGPFSYPQGKGSKGKGKESKREVRRQRNLNVFKSQRKWTHGETQAHIAMLCLKAASLNLGGWVIFTQLQQVHFSFCKTPKLGGVVFLGRYC